MSAGSGAYGSAPSGRRTATQHAALRPSRERYSNGSEPTVERSWGRREFMGSVAASALGGLVPSIATAVIPARASVAATIEPGSQLLADWTIDDVFGVWPRYADPIPHACAPADDMAPAEPFDAL